MTERPLASRAPRNGGSLAEARPGPENEAMSGPREEPGGKGLSLPRLIPLLVLVAGLVLFFALGLDDYVSPAALGEFNEELMEFGMLWWAPFAFLLVYAAAIAFSLPGGAVMTIAGGYMFGQFLATGLVVVAATVGATVLFLVAKTSLGDALRAKAGPALKRMEAGFRENALSYLLVLRLIPLFPFWLVNLVPAFLGVPLGTYLIGTFFGIIPGSFIYASLGAGLEDVISQGEEISLSGVLTPAVVTGLVGLAVLALLPVVYKKLKGRKTA